MEIGSEYTYSCRSPWPALLSFWSLAADGSGCTTQRSQLPVLCILPPVTHWYTPQWQSHQRTSEGGMTLSCTWSRRWTGSERGRFLGGRCAAQHLLNSNCSLVPCTGWSAGQVVRYSGHKQSPSACTWACLTAIKAVSGTGEVKRTWLSQSPQDRQDRMIIQEEFWT